MEIEGQYLTYEEYKGLGGTLDLTPFTLLEFEARRQIDIRTFDRIKALSQENIPQEEKLCDYKLINSIESYAESLSNISNNGNVANESTDGYSISYITSDKISEIVKSQSSEIDDIVRTYLLRVVINGEHVMYCGV